MARHYGIPYMGSKQKLVDKIVPFILKRHPGTTDFYDLFGGGGSVSLYAVRKYPDLNVHYNELSKAIGSLMQYLKDGGDIPYNFVTRAEFEKRWHGDDWYAGLLQTCWTFGNRTNASYLYGKDIEEFKLKLHNTIYNGELNLGYLSEFVNTYFKRSNINLYLDPKRYTTPHQRRIVLQRQCSDLRMQHYHYLDRLVHITNMPGINDLNITVGLSYADVPIGGQAILYCDPPYENSAEYKEGGFDSKAFYDWVATRPYPVYVSSYKISDDRLKLVKAINTRSLMHASQSDKPSYNYENLYWNGIGDVEQA